MENENFYKLESDDSLDLKALEEEKALEADSLSLNSGDVLRIVEIQTERFSGVRSCSKPSTHQKAAARALNRWVKEQMYEHRHLRWIRFGHLGGTAKWRNYTTWDGRRYCNGHVSIKCYIEFRKI